MRTHQLWQGQEWIIVDVGSAREKELLALGWQATPAAQQVAASSQPQSEGMVEEESAAKEPKEPKRARKSNDASSEDK